MVRNVIDRVRQEHQIDLRIGDQAMQRLKAACLSTETLQLGGRGIGSILETSLVNPLANCLFRMPFQPHEKVELDLSQGEDIWTASLSPV
jgi:ATP-dependent Clp protease ATP-binding subunit ClpA